MFSQLLKLFPRTEFQALVTRTSAERHARGFTCWGQFGSRCCSAVRPSHSLREICGGLRSSEGKLRAWESRRRGAAAFEHSSTNIGPGELYRAVFEALRLRCQPLAQGQRSFASRTNWSVWTRRSSTCERDPVRTGQSSGARRGGQAALPVGPRWLPAERGGHHPRGSGVVTVRWPAPCASIRAPSW